MASGSCGRADVARGGTAWVRRALRPRGKTRVARAGLRWRTGREHVAGGHAVHAVHADAREG